MRSMVAWSRERRSARVFVVVGAGGLAVLFAAAAVLAFGAASASTDPGAVVPVPVPAAVLPVINSAAASCPALTAPRLAGQVMANSGFVAAAAPTPGGHGIAGLTDQAWGQWSPSPGAQRLDDQANIVALAHDMCDLVGKSRWAGVGGDLWQAALAFFDAGLSPTPGRTVTPSGTAGYVARVMAYAERYQQLPEFGGVGATSASPSPAGSVSMDAQLSETSPTPRAGLSSTLAPPAPPTVIQTTPTGGAPVQIVGYGSDGCIDVTDGDTTNDPQLQIWTCTGGPNQRWTFYNDGTLRAFGECMTVSGSSTASGVPILLSRCSGSAGQQFVLNAAHDLVNTHADKCVDATDRGTASGTKLQLWTCKGTSNQKWHL